MSRPSPLEQSGLRAAYAQAAEGFVNLPIIADWTALRISAYSDYHGAKDLPHAPINSTVHFSAV